MKIITGFIFLFLSFKGGFAQQMAIPKCRSGTGFLKERQEMFISWAPTYLMLSAIPGTNHVCILRFSGNDSSQGSVVRGQQSGISQLYQKLVNLPTY